MDLYGGSAVMRMGDLMTTDQIKRAEADAKSAEAEHEEHESAVDAARTVADEIIAKARYDAFRMVTDARTEAEAILAQAETEAPSPQPTSDTGDTEAELSERAVELTEEVARLDEVRERLIEKVTATRALLNNLEERLARIAKTPPLASGGTAATPTQHSITVEVTSEETDPLPPAASVDAVPAAAIGAGTEPPVGSPQSDGHKGSFYSRRSAKLPSIGASGGQSALSAMSSIRNRIDS